MWAFHRDRVLVLVIGIIHSLVFPMYFVVPTGVVSWQCKYVLYFLTVPLEC